MALKNALTEPLRSSNPAEVLERSLEKGRLPHAMLLHGDHYPLLEELALGLASVLLDINADAQSGPERFDKVEKHPDFFPLRPSKKPGLFARKIPVKSFGKFNNRLTRLSAR